MPLRAKLSGFGLTVDSKVAVLTGAGVSAESGVPTFRGAEGLWKTYRAEELATPEAFERDPRTVWEWYDWRRQIVAGKEPNPAHHAIADLDRALRAFLLVTQNVDGLHARAGSRRMVELHGSLWRMRCTVEGTVTERLDVPLKLLPPMCECGALLRPDVVWFGEGLPQAALSSAADASRSCDLMLVVGTSAVVQPAASMPLLTKQAGGRLVEINPDDTPLTPFADLSLRGKAGEIMPDVAEALIEIMGASS